MLGRMYNYPSDFNYAFVIVGGPTRKFAQLKFGVFACTVLSSVADMPETPHSATGTSEAVKALSVSALLSALMLLGQGIGIFGGFIIPGFSTQLSVS